jgi:hypothetical protein
VRSTHGHFVKASGLRWLCLMVTVQIPFIRRRWALPFLTIAPATSTSTCNQVTSPSRRARAIGSGRYTG